LGRRPRADGRQALGCHDIGQETMGRRKMTESRSAQFKEGACYFLVGYYDDDMKLPAIESYIYLGKNLLGEAESEERWYFQEAESFVRNGRVLPSKGRKNDDILTTLSEHLGDFLDPEQLARLLKKLVDKSQE
jgi:hypothetical protein